MNFKGYKLIEDSLNSLGNTSPSELNRMVISDTPENNEITLAYESTKQPITVHYQDASGKTLAKDASDEWYTDDKRQVKTPRIKGYYLKDNAQATLTVKPGQNEVTVVYTKNPVLDTNEISDLFINMVNEYRQENGLHALQKNDLLVAGSNARAQDELGQMKKSNNFDDFDHDTSDGKDYNTESNLFSYSEHGKNTVGENLAQAMGFLTPEEVAKSAFEALKASPKHNAQMLNNNFNDTGVGVAQFDDDEWILVENFGSKIPDNVWDSSDFNTATPDKLHHSQQEIGNFSMVYYNDLLHSGSENYYVGHRIFKSENDFDNWRNSFANNPKSAASIWTKGGTEAKLTANELRDYDGQVLGYVPFITNMDKPAKDYIDAGATEWF